MPTTGLDSQDCPAWCRQQHDPADPFDEAVHTTEATWIPVVVLTQDWNLAPRALHVNGADLVISIRQPQDSSEPWLCVEESEGDKIRLWLSIEGGQRLLRAVQQQMEQL